MSAYDLAVYYDGACPLCRLEIGHYRRQRGAERIRFVDVSDYTVDPGPGLDRDSAMGRFHVRLPNGELMAGAAAFVEVWRVLPRYRAPAGLTRLPGVVPMLEIGYRLFSPVRPRLAKVIGKLGLA